VVGKEVIDSGPASTFAPAIGSRTTTALAADASEDSADVSPDQPDTGQLCGRGADMERRRGVTKGDAVMPQLRKFFVLFAR
jgi:hypothetical protein